MDLPDWAIAALNLGLIPGMSTDERETITLGLADGRVFKLKANTIEKTPAMVIGLGVVVSPEGSASDLQLIRLPLVSIMSVNGRIVRIGLE